MVSGVPIFSGVDYCKWCSSKCYHMYLIQLCVNIGLITLIRPREERPVAIRILFIRTINFFIYVF